MIKLLDSSTSVPATPCDCPESLTLRVEIPSSKHGKEPCRQPTTGAMPGAQPWTAGLMASPCFTT